MERVEETTIYYVKKQDFLKALREDKLKGLDFSHVDLDKIELKEEIPFWKNNQGVINCLPFGTNKSNKYSPFKTEPLILRRGFYYRVDTDKNIRDMAIYCIHTNFKNVKETIYERYIETIKEHKECNKYIEQAVFSFL